MQRRRQTDVEDVYPRREQFIVIVKDAAVRRLRQRFGLRRDRISDTDHDDGGQMDIRARVDGADEASARDTDANFVGHAGSPWLIASIASRKAKFAGRPPVCRKMIVSSCVTMPL